MTRRALEAIHIRNFRGLDQRDFIFHEDTVICGPHGSGKSTAIDAIAIFKPGTKDAASDIRKGAKKAELELKMADEYHATKVITPKSVTLTVFNPQGGIMEPPADRISELIPVDSLNTSSVIAKIAGDPKALGEFLLKENASLRVEPEEVNALFGEQIAFQSMTIPELRSLEKAKFKERTKVNGDAERAKKTLESLEARVGPVDPTDWGVVRDAAVKEIAEIDSQLGTLKSELEADGKLQKDAQRQGTDAVVKAAQKEIDALDDQIRALKQKHKDAESEYEKYVQRVDTAIAEALAAESSDLNKRKTAAVTRKEEAKTKAAKQASDQGIRDMIPAQEAETQGYITRSTDLTILIEGLRKLATDAINKLGIPGLSIFEDGDDQIIMYDAGDGVGPVRVDKLNEEKRIKLGVAMILKAQEGVKRKVLIVEGAGAILSIDHLAAACAAADAQLIIAIPDVGELRSMSLVEYKAWFDSPERARLLDEKRKAEAVAA